MAMVNNNVGEYWSSTTTSLLGSELMGGYCSDLSIERDSNATGGEGYGDSPMGEVESPYKGGFYPIEASPKVFRSRRGLSTFYHGKSKSFASLACASSVQDLAKPENVYARRRKNRSGTCSPLKSNGGGISKKKSSKMGKTNLALAVAITATSSEAYNINTTTTCYSSELEIDLVSPTFSPFQKTKPMKSGLSPIHDGMSACQSFSLANLPLLLSKCQLHNVVDSATSSKETQCPF